MPGKNHRTVREPAAIHEGESRFERFDPFDAQHRAEDLLIADRHVRRHVVEDRRTKEEALFESFHRTRPAIADELRAFLDAFI